MFKVNNYEDYLIVLEHGKNLGRKEVVDKLVEGLNKLQAQKGIGEKTMKLVYESLEIEWSEKNEES